MLVTLLISMNYFQVMDRFTLRGRIKVNIQWMLYCLVHNIEKIGNFGKTHAVA